MEFDDCDCIVITYMFLKKLKWKTKTIEIKTEDLFKYEKYRILNKMSIDEYYSIVDK